MMADTNINAIVGSVVKVEKNPVISWRLVSPISCNSTGDTYLPKPSVMTSDVVMINKDTIYKSIFTYLDNGLNIRPARNITIHPMYAHVIAVEMPSNTPIQSPRLKSQNSVFNG